jgi:predicted amidohydrolase YtcJ
MPDAANLLFTGGEIVTLNPDAPMVAALAVANGRIVALGAESVVRAACDARTRHVDLAGRCLLPSFKDHHLHLQAIGFALLNRELGGELYLDLSATGSEIEMVEIARARAARQPKGSWIVGSGWNETLWEGRRQPSHHALSAALPEHPAFLVRIDSHSALVNERAMAVAGITRDIADPPGGEIRRAAGGAPTGMLVERAVEAVLHHMPLPSDDVVARATLLAAKTMAARGYTEVFDAGIMHFPGLVASV